MVDSLYLNRSEDVDNTVQEVKLRGGGRQGEQDSDGRNWRMSWDYCEGDKGTMNINMPVRCRIVEMWRMGQLSRRGPL